MLREVKPRHGDIRSDRQEWTARGHVVISEPVAERYCGRCSAWQPQRGILAPLIGCPDCGAEWTADDAAFNACPSQHDAQGGGR